MILKDIIFWLFFLQNVQGRLNISCVQRLGI
ncbi:hypothetical protein C357_23225 [Citreicella sp. 357]|nr:hypothetical protein C357_23225 [Citreicella sp. 357]